MIELGDVVRIGLGERLWHVDEFYGQEGQLARLSKVKPTGEVDGYVHTSARVRDLCVVQKRVL